VHDESVSAKLARLRAEIEQIKAQNRLYFAKKSHRKSEIEQHQHRHDRVIEIKLELETLLKKKSA
jgi:hypothetical protein